MVGKDVKQAIVLNAGEGSRLRPLTKNMPKCLLKIGDKTILEHQLNNLIKCGIEEVTFVIGYYSDMIIRKIEQSSFDLEIKYVDNPIYYKTNTVYSLWLARKEMNDNFIYLNGDVLFHENVLKRLVESEYATCLAIDKKNVGKEEIKVKIVNNIIKEIGKEIEPSTADGEFIGIAKFSKEINVSFKKKLDEVVKEGKTNAFFELAVQRMLQGHNVYAIDISDLPCIEIDTHQDYNEAKRIYLKMMVKKND